MNPATKRYLAHRARKFGGRRLMESLPVRWGTWAVDAASFTPRVLERSLGLAGEVATVIDIGASDGRWSERARDLLPNARYLLFEANPEHHAALAAYAAGTPNTHVEYSAASDKRGTINFYMDPDNPLGGAASDKSFDEFNQMTVCAPVDEVVESHGLIGPFLMKLDTQGHEREILQGAAKVLSETSLVIIEAYGVEDSNRMAFDELCLHMRSLGFRTAGLADPLMRPADGMFWQMDLFFIRADHSAFADKRFH